MQPQVVKGDLPTPALCGSALTVLTLQVILLNKLGKLRRGRSPEAEQILPPSEVAVSGPVLRTASG